MKATALLLAACMAANLCGMTDAERQHLRNLALRPRCESRRYVVVGGVTNIVETWRRGGYEWAQTNAVRHIVGTPQRNTFEQKVAELREAAEQWRASWQSATNRAEIAEARAAIAEARAARLTAFRAWLVEQRDKTPLQTTKKIYQAIIDRLDGEDE